MHPATLWTITRKSVVPNPSAHKQWNATGKENTNARLPLQRWSTEPQAGAAPAPGRRPHIHSAVTSCTISRATAAVPSQTFICSIPENPRVNNGRPAGVCTLAYTPNVTATAAPARSTATSPARLIAARRSVAIDIASPPPGTDPSACIDLPRCLTCRVPSTPAIASANGRTERDQRPLLAARHVSTIGPHGLTQAPTGVEP